MIRRTLEACATCRFKECRKLPNPEFARTLIATTLSTHGDLIHCPLVLRALSDLEEAVHTVSSSDLDKLLRTLQERFRECVHPPSGSDHRAVSDFLDRVRRSHSVQFLGIKHRQEYPSFLVPSKGFGLITWGNPEPIALSSRPSQAAAPDATSVSSKSKPRPAPGAVVTCFLSVFTDGTGNDMDVDFPSGCATNVAKLYMLSKKGREGDVIRASHYIRGVGTGHGWDGSPGLVVGMGFDERVHLALQWLGQRAAEHPTADIVVDLFGFSRGAAEAMQVTHSLNDPAVLASHGFTGRKLSVRFVGLFDPVSETGLPKSDLDISGSLALHAFYAQTVVSLVAMGEVRSTFNLRSLRVPPAKPFEARDGGDDFQKYNSLDWAGIVASQHLPSPQWHEWRVPGVHADVGGGYSPEEWIPDLVPEPPHPQESVEAYTCRMKDREMKMGAPPRGLHGNDPEPKAVVMARIVKVHQEGLGNSFLPTSESAIRCRDNSLSRIYLWIMKTQAEKAGVVWKDVEDIRPSYQPSVRKLDGSHPLHSLHQYSDHPGLMEGILTTDLFWRQVVPHMHDSRWSGDVFSGSRKRRVFFDGRTL